MKKFSTLVLLIALLFVVSSQISSALDIKPYRIGVKVGLPNLLGGNVEYVTPFLNNKLAVNASLSYIPVPGDNDNQSWAFMFWHVGLNYYFFDKGKGLFAGVNFARLSLSYTEKNMNGYYTDPGGNEVLVNNGTGEVSLGANLVQIIAGYRFVWGWFTLEPEIGYQAGSMDKNADVKITYQGGSAVEKKEVPGSLGVSGMSLSIMFGVAF